MKNIKFLRFGGKNFKNHIDPIEVDVIDNGITLITGPNGSGKTSLFEILPFTFFGRTPKGLTSNDVVNNKMDKDCVTFVDYEIKEEDETIDKYKCIRYCKYKSVGNNVILSKNDNKKYRVGHKEVIKEINKIWSKDVFMNTMFFAQKVKDFFMDLQDSDQKQIFKSILRTQDYEEYKKIVNIREKENNDKLIDVDNQINLQNKLIEDYQSQIIRLQNEKDLFYENKKERISLLNQEIKQAKDKLNELLILKEKIDIDNLQQQLELITKIKNDLEYRLSNIKKRIEDEYNNLKNETNYNKKEIESKFNDEKNDIVSKVNDILNKMRSELDVQVDELQNEANSLSENLKKLELQENNIKNSIDNIDNTIELFFKDSSKLMSQSSCPLCKSEINDDVKNRLQKEVDELKNKKQDLINEKEKIEPELIEISNNYNKIRDDMSQLKKNFLENKNKKEKDCNDEIEILKAKFKEYIKELEISFNSKLKEIDEKYDKEEKELIEQTESKQNQLSLLKEKITDYNDLLIEINNLNNQINLKIENLKERESDEFDDKQIIYYDDKIKDHIKEIENLSENKINLEKRSRCLEFWKKAFSNSGIPSMLIDDAIPFMNITIRKYLDEMTYGRYIVSFDTLKETKSGEFRDKISINIYDNITGANQRQQLSGGQSRLIDIATILTLADLQSYMQNINNNILIFDEVFDSLDTDNILMVSKALRKIAKNKSIYIISHSHIEQLEYDNHIQFHK